MNLSEKQRLFTRLLGTLIKAIYDDGHEATLGDAYRSPEMAAIYAKQGKGIKNSLHTLRLAMDLNLFKDGKYLSDSKSYTVFGEYWESLGKTYGVNTTWGGRFSKPDGNHFSIEHEGIK